MKAIVVVVAGLLLSPLCRADLLFSDSFEYAPGSLDGDGPPPGSPPGQGPWESDDTGDPLVIAEGLSYPGVFSAGGATSFFGYQFGSKGSAASLAPINSGTVYIGFMMRQVSGRPSGIAQVVLLTAAGVPIPVFGEIGHTGFYGMDNGTGLRHDQKVSHVPVDSQTTWLVVSLNFETGEETLLINPTLDENGKVTGAAAVLRLRMAAAFQANGFIKLLYQAGYSKDGNFEMDELRVGTTFSDVVGN